MTTGEIRELKAYWRQRIKDARAVYLHATLQHTRMVEELGQGLVGPSDGAFAVAQARRAKAWASCELTRTMTIYAALAVKGIVPPPEEDEKLIV